MMSPTSMAEKLGTQLDLSQQALTDTSLRDKLSSHTNLTGISLVSNDIADASCLSSCTSLRTVNIMRNPLKNIDWVEPLTGLEVLEISSTDVSDLTPLTKLTSLRQLSASNTKIRTLRSLSSCHNLEVLYLSDNDLPNDLSSLTSLQNLRELYISGIPKLTANMIMTLIQLPNLQVLEVDEDFRSVKNHVLREVSNRFSHHCQFLIHLGTFRFSPEGDNNVAVLNLVKQRTNAFTGEMSTFLRQIPNEKTRGRAAAMIVDMVCRSLEDSMVPSPPADDMSRKP